MKIFQRPFGASLKQGVADKGPSAAQLKEGRYIAFKKEEEEGRYTAFRKEEEGRYIAFKKKEEPSNNFRTL